MSQLIFLSGTMKLNGVVGQVVVSGSIPSALDIDAPILTALASDFASLQTAIQGNATFAQLDADAAKIEAMIAALGGVTPPPPPPPATRYPASGADAAFMPWVTPATTPAPGATLILGDTIGAGTFLGGIDMAAGSTVNGAGIGQTIIDISGQRPIARKAAILTEGPGCTIAGMTVTGSAISYADGWNAGGVCNGAVGWDMTLGPLEIYGCQEGIRSLGGNVTALMGGHVHHCGGDVPTLGGQGGLTHGVYLNDASGNNGSDRSLVRFTGWLMEKSLFAHEFKSRLYSYIMKNNTFVSTPIPGSAGTYNTNFETQLGGNGSCVDLPNGGDWQGFNNIYTKGAGSQDFNVISYGEEGLYPNYATVMHDESPTLNNQTGREVFIQVGPGCTVVWNNPTLNGYHLDPSAQGGGTFTMTGTITRNFDP